MPKLPDNCRSMRDVREGVDAIDRDLVEILAKRFGYMRAAARIKEERGAVRDEARKAAVISAARSAAAESGVPDDVVGALWEILVEGSIAYELEEWDRLRPAAD